MENKPHKSIVENAAPHWLDNLIWDSETWVEQFNALLNALEFQFALEDEFAEDD
jgi:hypothetical protein